MKTIHLGIFVLAVLIASPTHAALNEADLQCIPAIQQCGCGQVMGPKGCTGGTNKWMCPCVDMTNGFPTKGICVANNDCKGVSTTGQDGSAAGIGDPSQLLSSIMQMVSQLAGGGGGGGGAPPPAFPTDTLPEPTLADDLLDSSGTGGNLDGGVAGSLLNALGGTSKKIEEAIKGSGSSVVEVLKERSGETSATNASSSNTALPGLNPSTSGDIVVSGSGATVKAEVVDPRTNSSIAGFLGAGSGSLAQSKSIVGKLCVSRPWATNFLSSIISPTFFDGICSWAGYNSNPTVVAPTPQSGAFQQPKPKPPVQNAAPEVTYRPQVDIWADPAVVRLGTRTYIFWSSRDVATCEAKGPSFSQKTLSGGASTVPITDVSTFTITCVTPDGTVTVEDSTTVQLAI